MTLRPSASSVPFAGLLSHRRWPKLDGLLQTALEMGFSFGVHGTPFFRQTVLR